MHYVLYKAVPLSFVIELIEIVDQLQRTVLLNQAILNVYIMNVSDTVTRASSSLYNIQFDQFGVLRFDLLNDILITQYLF